MTNACSNNIVIIGRATVDALEGSYARAFRRLGFSVTVFDNPRSLRRSVRLGKVGEVINTFWPCQPWIAKANRELLTTVFEQRPDIVIVDEPVTGLDPVHAFSAMARLAAWAAQGRTVIASLHDLTLAARYAGRILALKQGRVAGEGALTPALIRDVFGVESEIRGTGTSAKVDFLLP